MQNFTKIGFGIQITFRLLPLRSERLQCSYYYWEGFMVDAVAMASGGMIYTYQVSLTALCCHALDADLWQYFVNFFLRDFKMSMPET
jgi:hypothetical protein